MSAICKASVQVCYAESRPDITRMTYAAQWTGSPHVHVETTNLTLEASCENATASGVCDGVGAGAGNY